MKKIFPLLAVGILLLPMVAHATSTPSVLQFRLVVDSPTADSEPMTIVQSGQSPYPPEVLNVQKEVLLDQTAVKSATFEAQLNGIPANVRGPMTILIKFTDEGAKQLSDITRQNIGRRLAVIIDGRLFVAPRINTAITGGVAEIAGNFTKEEASVLATKLNGSPAREVISWSRIGFYCFIPLFAAAAGIIVWMAIRRKDTSLAA